MKRNKTIHYKASFYFTLCGYRLFDGFGNKTKCRASKNWDHVTCENCIKIVPKTGADNDSDE